MIVELSKASLSHRIATAKRGQWIMYHVGFLFIDRTKDQKLNAVAGEAWAQHEAGVVELKQRKLRDMVYEYYAAKR